MLLIEDLQQLSQQFGLDYLIDVSQCAFIKNKIKKLPYSFVQHNIILPIDETEKDVILAVASPFNVQAIEEARFILGKDIKEVLCLEAIIKSAIEYCYHQNEEEASAYIQNLNQKQEGELYTQNDQEYDLLNEKSDSSVIRMLNMILLEALQLKSSDIHLEPIEHGMIVRYRIDGVLQARHKAPKEIVHQLVTRIKVLARLDIAEHRLPQDGRIKLKLGDREIDFRVSTVPTAYGERIVLRILDNKNIVIGLEHIEMDEELLQDFQYHIRQNQGIVLVTGPTGSGKTTTLYSALSQIQSDEVNIMTIEDPVEYKLPKMAQIGVNPKIDLTFARGLRHILRQDPDVIMIGEIRDKETAEIAIQAALTGHLVLSTLHTNDAPSALTRLVDMGIEPYLLSSTILAVLAQRLARQICPHCKTEHIPSPQQLKDIGLEAHEGPFYMGQGCECCLGVGYSGRIGIYELMNMDKEIKQHLLQSPDANELREIAKCNHMKTLREDGAKKALKGLTTVSEVIRVTRKI
ncbi:MAG: type II secretion system ATPase GspE [Chlamydiales bacterium]|nr:type II secretion system ATPase GspE [Chlamydiales bacterium]